MSAIRYNAWLHSFRIYFLLPFDSQTSIVSPELLRVIRRLSMKEQWTDISLQFLTLRILLLALSENPRGQSHFKSIGGLEVLLDGLGLTPNNFPCLKNISSADAKRYSYQYLYLSIRCLFHLLFNYALALPTSIRQ